MSLPEHLVNHNKYLYKVYVCQALFQKFYIKLHETRAVIIPIAQIRKLRITEVE